jgi:hypothetical protein
MSGTAERQMSRLFLLRRKQNCDFMKTIILMGAALAGLLITAHAQMGWSLSDRRR